MSKTMNRFSPEAPARVVQLVPDHDREHTSRWATVASVAAKISCSAPTLHEWVKKADPGRSHKAAISPYAAERLKALERGKNELRQANEISRKASVYFAVAEPDRRFRA